MKNVLTKIQWIALVLLFAFCLAVADPTLAKYYELSGSFFFDPLYIRDCLSRFGTVFRLTAAFLTQFFVVKGLGVAIIALLLGLSVRCLSSGKSPNPLAVLLLLPATLLFCGVKNPTPAFVGITVVSLLFLVLRRHFRWTIRLDKKLSLIIWTVCVVFAITLCAVRPQKEIALYKICAVETNDGNYSKVIRVCRNNQKIVSGSQLLTNYYYMALAKKGLLVDWASSQKAFNGKSVIMQKDKTPYVGALLSGVYYECGLIAASQKNAFEANEMFGGYSPSLLLRLIRTNIALGYDDVARKYAGLLSKTIFYRTRAVHFESYLDGKVQDRSLDRLRLYSKVRNNFTGYLSLIYEIKAVLDCVGENKFALQYALAEAIITNNAQAYKSIKDKYEHTSPVTVQSPVSERDSSACGIFPDYSGVTVPVNIAPLTFGVKGASRVSALFESNGLSIKCSGKEISVPVSRWHRFLSAAAGSDVKVSVTAIIDGEKQDLPPFEFFVSPEEIDPYLAYRLIEPGYELWNRMGIYQRNLTNFKESAIVTNDHTGGNCMNCHSFCNRQPDRFLFHLRAANGGTYFVDGAFIEKLNTKTPETISALVYPQWHPSGKYVAFSTNITNQSFHTTDPNRIEVYDIESDVVVYDVDNHEIISCPQLKGLDFETYPTFSPDGKRLFFCTAQKAYLPYQYDQVKYSLCAIDFDPQLRRFGTTVDTLYNARESGNSVSLPRISPDGRFLMFTLQSYGNFGIWHKDSDEYLMDLCTGNYWPMTRANSADVDSYHSWSSNGRWAVISSRRADKLYTRLYITHIDESGAASKAFLLPQKTTSFYQSLLKSYNIPEFVTGKVSLNQRRFGIFAKTDHGTDLKYITNNQ